VPVIYKSDQLKLSHDIHKGSFFWNCDELIKEILLSSDVTFDDSDSQPKLEKDGSIRLCKIRIKIKSTLSENATYWNTPF
jgi:hypothetical protein